MSYLKSVITVLSFLIFTLLLEKPIFSMSSDEKFDLEGNGRLIPVKLPFPYYHKKQGDKLSLIHQGGYKVFDVSEQSSDVAVIGPLRPCIAVVVTDGKKLVAFHKHFSNSLLSMKKVLTATLDLSSSNLCARIYTTEDPVEWIKMKRQEMHAGKSHLEEVKRIKDFLEKEVGISRTQIPANLYHLRDNKGKFNHPEFSLGQYEFMEVCVAVRLSHVFAGEQNRIPQFFSIDPFKEDIFGYEGQHITYVEYLGPNLEMAQSANPDFNFIQLMPYDDIPRLYLNQSGQTNGYRQQRGICERRMYLEEDKCYKEFFKKSSQDLFRTDDPKKLYDSLDFYPL